MLWGFGITQIHEMPEWKEMASSSGKSQSASNGKTGTVARRWKEELMMR